MKKLTALEFVSLSLAAVGAGGIVAWLMGWHAHVVPGPDGALGFLLVAAAFSCTSRPMVARVAGGLLAGLSVAEALFDVFGQPNFFGFIPMPAHLAVGFLLCGLILARMHGVKNNWSAWLIELACLGVVLLGVFHVVDQLTGLRIVSGDLINASSTLTAALLGGLGFGLWFLVRRTRWYQEFDAGRIDWKITAVSGIVLLLIAFAAAAASFVMMAEQAERTMKDSLALSLANRIRMFQHEVSDAVRVVTAIGQHVEFREALEHVSVRGDLPEYRARVAATIARLPDIAYADISAAAVHDGAGRLLARTGDFVPDSSSIAHLPVAPSATLLWDRGVVLQMKLDIVEGNRRLGVLMVDIRLEQVDVMLNDRVGLGDSGAAVLCGRAGEDLQCAVAERAYRYNKVARDRQGKPLPMVHALAGNSGVSSNYDYGGREVVSAYAPVGSWDLGMLLKIDKAEMQQPIRVRLWTMLVALAVLALIGLLLLRWRITPLADRLLQEVSTHRGVEAELRLLQAITAEIDQAPDAQTALTVVLERICQATGWAFGQAWIPSPDGTHLRYSPAWSGEPGLASFSAGFRDFAFAPGQGLPGRVWVARKPEWLREGHRGLLAKPRRAERMRQAGLKARMGIPILADDEVVAVLEFAMRAQREEDAHSLHLASLIAAQLGNAIRRKHTDEALRESEERYRALVESVDAIVWQAEPDTFRFTYVSPQAERILGYPVRAWLESPGVWQDRLHPEDRERAIAYCTKATQEGRDHEFEYRMIASDGRVLWLRDNVTVTVHDGRPVKLHGIMLDITEIKRTAQDLSDSEVRYRALIENSMEAIYLYDPVTKRVLDANPAFLSLLGFTRADLDTLSMYDFITHPRDSVGSFTRNFAPGETGAIMIGERVWVGKNGVRRYMDVTAGRMHQGGKAIGFTVARDITEQKRAQERLTYLAHYDELTGLPNRALFNEHLRRILRDTDRLRRLVAVMFLDLDRFKTINDTLGHEMGDTVLKGVAERLRECMRRGDVIARLGGDEFTIALADVAHYEDVAYLAQKILDSFSRPFPIGGRDLFLTTSIGIAVYPRDHRDAEGLLKHADAAMYRAKDHGRNNYQFFTQEMNMEASKRLTLETHLRRALERNEFVLHYQPQVDLGTGAIMGMEALIRWQSPELGTVAPVEFIPLAEETGLIVAIGEWVLRTACSQNQAWQEAGLPRLRVSVNLSARQFREKSLAETVERTLRETRLAPKYLELELTESLLQDVDVAEVVLNALRDLGVRVSVDDFGTGYSSFNYLKRFPIDNLKIDRSFVRDVITDPDDAAITDAIINMAHTLGIYVVAEGVETGEQLAFLHRHRCDLIQGYYFSKPLPADAFAELLLSGRRLPLSERHAPEAKTQAG